jgi:hypothetical protein
MTPPTVDTAVLIVFGLFKMLTASCYSPSLERELALL